MSLFLVGELGRARQALKLQPPIRIEFIGNFVDLPKRLQMLEQPALLLPTLLNYLERAAI